MVTTFQSPAPSPILSFPSHSTVQTTCAIRAAVIPVIFVVAAACIWSCGVFSFCRHEITAQSICAQSPVSGPEVLRRLLCYCLVHAANSATPGRWRGPASSVSCASVSAIKLTLRILRPPAYRATTALSPRIPPAHLPGCMPISSVFPVCVLHHTCCCYLEDSTPSLLAARPVRRRHMTLDTTLIPQSLSSLDRRFRVLFRHARCHRERA